MENHPLDFLIAGKKRNRNKPKPKTKLRHTLTKFVQKNDFDFLRKDPIMLIPRVEPAIVKDQILHSSSSSEGSQDGLQLEESLIINDIYLVKKKIGEGTFGSVYKCQNLKDSNKCALKIIKSNKSFTDDAKMESKILSDVMNKSTKNVVKYFNDFEYFSSNSKKTYYGLVFEVLGKNLYQFTKLNRGMGFPMVYIQQFALQILEAIEGLHNTCQLVHTDIKPENILLEKNQAQVIIDRSKIPKVN